MTTDQAIAYHQTPAAVEGPVDPTVVPLVPKRVRLSRAKGWRMPPNTAKVDRTTDWGNPFVVGKDGTAAECVQRFEMMLAGLVEMRSAEVVRRQLDFLRTLQDGFSLDRLRGKNLACWCCLDKPCHADVLLRLANLERHNAKLTGPSEHQGSNDEHH